MRPARALLAGSAPVSGHAFMKRQLSRGRAPWLVIAANGGRVRLGELAIRPDVTIGDFDSATTAPSKGSGLLPSRGGGLRPSPRPAGIEVRHPREKDETDLELAFAYAAKQPGIAAVTVVGGTGARLDHTLTNLDLGARWARRGLAVTFLDGALRVRFVTDEIRLERDLEFDTVSLIPWTAWVRGVTTRGLLYPLTDGALSRERGRGVSNQLVARTARIRVRSGLLIVVETRAC